MYVQICENFLFLQAVEIFSNNFDFLSDVKIMLLFFPFFFIKMEYNSRVSYLVSFYCRNSKVLNFCEFRCFWSMLFKLCGS